MKTKTGKNKKWKQKLANKKIQTIAIMSPSFLSGGS